MKRRSRLNIKNPFQFFALILIVAIATIWLGILGMYIWKQMQPSVSFDPSESPAPQVSPLPPQIDASPIPISPSIPPIAANPIPSPSATGPISPTIPDNPQPVNVAPPPNRSVQTEYGHFPYPQAQGDLVEVGRYYDRSELMVSEAANAFWTMQDAAANVGVRLGAISGFRTVGEQAKLFERQIQRHNGSKQAAAKLSAPPGHSEHHTGYTLDIRDLDRDDTDLKYAMENTAAYQWLRNNACAYGFELSFPDGNRQGVSFEPWHWRYIGSPTAKNLFQAARLTFQEPAHCTT